MSLSQRGGGRVKDEGEDETLEEWKESFEGNEDLVGRAQLTLRYRQYSSMNHLEFPVHVQHCDSLYAPLVLYTELCHSAAH